MLLKIVWNMKYYSTNDTVHPVDLRQAVMRSISPDGGVYMPDAIPLIPKALFNNIPDMSLTDIAYVAATSIFGSDIPPSKLNDIVKDTLTFPIPLVKVDDNRYALELFHGPTGSFKDIGARFMARIVSYFLSTAPDSKGKLNVFVATSGDTGSAVGHGFAGIENVNVFILHPKGKMLRVPKESFRAPASNIFPIGIRGTFDDCQRLVKEIYTDSELNRHINITSANSINIARLLPQTFFYFHGYAQLLRSVEKPGKIVIATPCGNLGNLTAALFSYQMGLPVDRILAAGHDNERLWGEMSSGQLSVSNFNSRALSTNLSRINSLFKHNPSMAQLLECHTYNDNDISRHIIETYRHSGYLMDRNTTMASYALTQSLKPGETGIFLATAHPAKYADRLKELLGVAPVSDKPNPSPHIHTKASWPALPPLMPAVKRFLLDNNNNFSNL